MKTKFTKLCNPAKVYLVLSILFVIYGLTQQFSVFTLGIKSFFILLWTMVLNMLCSFGHKGISWLLVVLPYLILGLSFLFHMDVLAMGGGINREGYNDPNIAKTVTYAPKLPKRKGIGAVSSQACKKEDIEKIKKGIIKSCEVPWISLGDMSRFATKGQLSTSNQVSGSLNKEYSNPANVDASNKVPATPRTRGTYKKPKIPSKVTTSYKLKAALDE